MADVRVQCCRTAEYLRGQFLEAKKNRRRAAIQILNINFQFPGWPLTMQKCERCQGAQSKGRKKWEIYPCKTFVIVLGEIYEFAATLTEGVSQLIYSSDHSVCQRAKFRDGRTDGNLEGTLETSTPQRELTLKLELSSAKILGYLLNYADARAVSRGPGWERSG